LLVGEDGFDDLADPGVARELGGVLGQVLADVVERAVHQHSLKPAEEAARERARAAQQRVEQGVPDDLVELVAVELVDTVRLLAAMRPVGRGVERDTAVAPQAARDLGPGGTADDDEDLDLPGGGFAAARLPVVHLAPVLPLVQDRDDVVGFERACRAPCAG
jgi:hypothetical protein